MRTTFAPALLLAALLMPLRVGAEGTLPTAQELVAIVEVGSAECIKTGRVSEQDQVALRKFVGSLFRQRAYQDYAESPEFAVARWKATEDIKKNGLDPTICGWLKRLPLLPPDQVMFFEPRK